MKRVEANRYPNSATLFKFCKEALASRFDGNVKVIDQDVGAILGYDPADCSHWKKGKKNVRTLSTIKSIAEHLNVDERLLIDIASGNVGLEEALYEYKGYGAFGFSIKDLEELKKDFFKNPSKWQNENIQTTFEETFDINRPMIVNMVEGILKDGHFTEAPIYLPEVFGLYPEISLEDNVNQESAVVINEIEGKTVISFRGPEMRPYMRFLLAKELFRHMIKNNRDNTASKQVQDVQANVFANMLLVPAKMLRSEVVKLDASFDIVSQLSETFWVSKSLMNQRLCDFFEHGV